MPAHRSVALQYISWEIGSLQVLRPVRITAVDPGVRRLEGMELSFREFMFDGDDEIDITVAIETTRCE